MARTKGNTALKAARQAAGYASQEAFAAALSTAGKQLGFGNYQVTDRQVRRWESATPPWPQDEQQQVITRVLGLPVEQLGFTAPWNDNTPTTSATTRRTVTAAAMATASTATLPLPTASAAGRQPASVAADFATITASHRRLYWTVQPAQMHPVVAGHASFGTGLLTETDGLPRQILARALAETMLMQGRIEFFDLRKPDAAADTYVRALQAAGEAQDNLLGAAILAHGAFIPGWAGDHEGMVERMGAARAYARRGDASAEMWAWLDCVEAECETRCGNVRIALNLLHHAEDVLAAGSETQPADWMDWFSPVRLQAFKGNTQLKAGHATHARTTLLAVLEQLPADSGKQRVVVLGDLAAVEIAEKHPVEACAYAEQALEQLAATSYETGMDRVREVRRQLQPWADEACVRRLDDRLYSWTAAVSALQR